MAHADRRKLLSRFVNFTSSGVGSSVGLLRELFSLGLCLVLCAKDIVVDLVDNGFDLVDNVCA